MDCKKDANSRKCTCTASCSTRGVCCDCLAYHLAQRHLPGCCFPAQAEKTYDRSFKSFARAWSLSGQ
jgi:hypothetical protein